MNRNHAFVLVLALAMAMPAMSAIDRVRLAPAANSPPASPPIAGWPDAEGLAGALLGPGGARPDRGARGYATELAAVRAATDRFNPLSILDDREVMGGILESAAGYYYSVTPGEPGRDEVTARIPVPEGFSLVAFWHTHGAPAPERQYFSHLDTELVRVWRIPFYLADATGELKVFEPGDATLSSYRAARLGLPRRPGFAAGRAVRDRQGGIIRVATARGLTEQDYVAGPSRPAADTEPADCPGYQSDTQLASVSPGATALRRPMASTASPAKHPSPPGR